MEQGPTLAAMLRGAGSMGNPQDVKRAAAKRWAKRGAVNGGIPDGSPGDAPGLPPHSGASGMLAGQLSGVNIAPDADPRTLVPGARAKRGHRPTTRPRRYQGKPPFQQSPYRRA